MKNMRNQLRSFVGFLVFVSLPMGLGAQTKFYYDGERRVEIAQDSELVAEIGSVPSGGGGLVKSANPTAALVKSTGGLQIYRAPYASTEQTIRSKSGTGSSRRLLPVYRTSSGTLVVPTGNIIVYFPVEWTDQAISVWAAKKGLRALQKLPLSQQNAWEIQTPPGDPSIDLANEIRSESRILSASPNFWMEIAKK
jgi:hypothetical protein